MISCQLCHALGGPSCYLQELEETELTLVASAATLAEMCTHLEGCREIAVVPGAPQLPQLPRHHLPHAGAAL